MVPRRGQTTSEHLPDCICHLCASGLNCIDCSLSRCLRVRQCRSPLRPRLLDCKCLDIPAKNRVLHLKSVECRVQLFNGRLSVILGNDQFLN